MHRFVSTISLRAGLFALALASVGACSSAPPAPASGPASSAKPTSAMSGTIQGFVKITTPPVLKGAGKRKDVAFCKDHPSPHEAILAKDGKLDGVFVRVEPDAIKGTWDAPAEPVHLTIENCAYHPRLVGLLAGGSFDVKNKDGIDHTVFAKKGDQSIFQYGLPKSGDAVKKKIDAPGIYKLGESDEPWAHAFVIVSDHPFFDVSHDGGSFKLEKVPVGRYMLQSYHPILGMKRMPVEVNDGKTSTIEFVYAGNEPEPPENQGDLKTLE